MRHLHRDLDLLKRRILGMGTMVETLTNIAIAAFEERRADLAEEAMASDARIDEKEVEIEEECLKILALHQPFAADLRFIITVLKVNNDLERMGDLAVNIAGRAAFLCTKPRLTVDTLQVEEMAGQVRKMVRMALDSLVNQDTQLAREVLAADEVVDNYHRRMFEVVTERMKKDPDCVERATHVISVSRALERIADLATNIAEDVVFLVEGEVIRHGLNQ
ncbi:MAG: phosphate signaling complex protein PhoU [Planctomycetota bacterium]